MVESATPHTVLLTLTEAADVLRVRDRRTAQRVLESNGVSLLQVGRLLRVRRADLDALLESLAEPPRPPLPSERSENHEARRRGRIRSRRDRRTNNVPTMTVKRRGWRERIESGLYRNHTTACPASTSKRPGSRCSCPFAAHVPTGITGKWSLRVLAASSVREARREKQQLQSTAQPKVAKSKDVTLDDFLAEYERRKVASPGTINTYKRRYKARIQPRFGRRKLRDIKPDDVQRWVAGLTVEEEARRRTTGTRTVCPEKRYGAVLSAILSQAVKWGYITSNPAAAIEYRPTPHAHPDERDREEETQRVFDEVQLAELYSAISRRWSGALSLRNELAIRCGSELGLRNSEVRGLRFSDFDLRAGRVHIVRQAPNGARYPQPTKGYERRHLPLTDRLIELVAAWQEHEIARGRKRSSYLFPGEDESRPLTSETLRDTFYKAQVEAGLVDEAGKHLLRFQGLRHTCASILLCSGVSVFKVSRVLGHSSSAITESVYAHLVRPTELDEITAIFNQMTVSATQNEPRGGPIEAERRFRLVTAA